MPLPLLNGRDLTDFQWAILDTVIPEPPRRRKHSENIKDNSGTSNVEGLI
jgi:hypothetical protein